MTTVLFDDLLSVAYGYAFLYAGADEQPDILEVRGGQANGLLGAAFPGVLAMTTGLHSGPVPLRVELLTTPPPTDDVWEEVVEASLIATGSHCALASFDESAQLAPLPPNTYRARFSGSGLDRAHAWPPDDGDSPVDRYLLQLWPDPTGVRPDAVLRQTSAYASYWHGVARETPAPPPPPPALTPEQIAANTAAEVERGERQMREMMAERILQSWGGRPPTPRLQAMTTSEPHGLASRDRDLVDDIAARSETEQRHIALWAAARAQALVDEPYATRLRPSLAAIRHGRSLPAPFDRREDALDGLFGRTPGESTTVSVTRSSNEPRPRVTPHVVALFTILAAARPDPLDAALSSVQCALWGEDDEPAYLAEVRRELERPA